VLLTVDPDSDQRYPANPWLVVACLFIELELPVKRTQKLLVSSFAGLALIAGLAGCPKKDDAGKTDGTAATAAAGGPVARINGTDIGRADFERQMERTKARFQRAGRQIAPALETRLKENLVRKLVEEELIAQKAKAEGVTVTPEELAAKVTEHKTRFGSDKAFASFLERTNQTEADVKADLEKNLLRDKLFAKLLASTEPTDEDAKKYYEENVEKYKQKEQIKASHILFKVEKDTSDKDKKAKLAEAKKVLAEAKKSGVDFGELAKKYSEGPTKDRAGDLGTFSRGRMVKQFEDAAFAAKAGDVIGPVETQFGYHVIKVYEKTAEKQRTFDEVKESILTSLKARQKSKATRELLDTLKSTAKIEVLEAGLSLDAKRPAAGAAGDRALDGAADGAADGEPAKLDGAAPAAPAPAPAAAAPAPTEAAPAAPKAP
jgi:peptidyl-prolyl cis-trans isomerase C